MEVRLLPSLQYLKNNNHPLITHACSYRSQQPNPRSHPCLSKVNHYSTKQLLEEFSPRDPPSSTGNGSRGPGARSLPRRILLIRSVAAGTRTIAPTAMILASASCLAPVTIIRLLPLVVLPSRHHCHNAPWSCRRHNDWSSS